MAPLSFGLPKVEADAGYLSFTPGLALCHGARLIHREPLRGPHEPRATTSLWISRLLPLSVVDALRLVSRFFFCFVLGTGLRKKRGLYSEINLDTFRETA